MYTTESWQLRFYCKKRIQSLICQSLLTYKPTVSWRKQYAKIFVICYTSRTLSPDFQDSYCRKGPPFLNTITFVLIRFIVKCYISQHSQRRFIIHCSSITVSANITRSSAKSNTNNFIVSIPIPWLFKDIKSCISFKNIVNILGEMIQPCRTLGDRGDNPLTQLVSWCKF